MTEADILHALRDCYDPVIACNIVDLGLVTSITVAPDPTAPGIGIPGVPAKFSVALRITPSHPHDDSEAQLTAQIANRLAGLEAISHTVITLVRTPAWTPQRITSSGRRALGLDGNPNLIQIAPAR